MDRNSALVAKLWHVDEGMPPLKDMPWHTFSTLILGLPNDHSNTCGHLEIGQRNFRVYKEVSGFSGGWKVGTRVSIESMKDGAL
jgi:hypothetical protein